MTGREYLNQIRDTDLNIRCKEREIFRLSLIHIFPSIQFNNSPSVNNNEDTQIGGVLMVGYFVL